MHTVTAMKKTTAKLQLKASTVRILHDTALARVAGGIYTTTYYRTVCSSSCNYCPTDASYCCDPYGG